MEAAQSRGRTILVNLHDWDKSRYNVDFREILIEHEVAAVFAGHLHETFGEHETIPQPGGYDMPVFLSGAPHYGNFLLIKIEENTLFVWEMVVDQLKGAQLRVLYNNIYTDVTAGNVDSIFSTSASRFPDWHERYYEYAIDVP